ncbi:MAG: hypothetical protein WC992_04030 [Acholeplasmataceae bacterium]
MARIPVNFGRANPALGSSAGSADSGAGAAARIDGAGRAAVAQGVGQLGGALFGAGLTLQRQEMQADEATARVQMQALLRAAELRATEVGDARELRGVYEGALAEWREWLGGDGPEGVPNVRWRDSQQRLDSFTSEMSERAAGAYASHKLTLSRRSTEARLREALTEAIAQGDAQGVREVCDAHAALGLTQEEIRALKTEKLRVHDLTQAQLALGDIERAGTEYEGAFLAENVAKFKELLGKQWKHLTDQDRHQLDKGADQVAKLGKALARERKLQAEQARRAAERQAREGWVASLDPQTGQSTWTVKEIHESGMAPQEKERAIALQVRSRTEAEKAAAKQAKTAAKSDATAKARAEWLELSGRLARYNPTEDPDGVELADLAYRLEWEIPAGQKPHLRSLLADRLEERTGGAAKDANKELVKALQGQVAERVADSSRRRWRRDVLEDWEQTALVARMQDAIREWGKQYPPEKVQELYRELRRELDGADALAAATRKWLRGVAPGAEPEQWAAPDPEVETDRGGARARTEEFEVPQETLEEGVRLYWHPGEKRFIRARPVRQGGPE